MKAKEFREALSTLEVSQRELARTLRVYPTTVNRWANDLAPIPGAVEAYLRLRLEVDAFRRRAK